MDGQVSLNNIETYRSLFNELEQWLRQLIKLPSGVIEFDQLLNRAAQINSAVGMYRTRIKRMVSIRHVIAHEHTDRHPWIVPSDQAIRGLREVLARVKEPPKLLSVGQRAVIGCALSDRIGKAARIMFENQFSQLPVHDGPRFVDLITSHTIACWVGSRLTDSMNMLEEESVQNVLTFRDKSETYVFLGSAATGLLLKI